MSQLLKKSKNKFEKNTIDEYFEKILNWKSARSKNLIGEDYKIYSNTFTEILSIENKLEKLIKLHGIYVSIASTILHFIYPDNYPIVDVRAVEALQSLGYIDKDVKVSAIRDAIKGYNIYNTKFFN